jgi:hypothetical protein
MGLHWIDWNNPLTSLAGLVIFAAQIACIIHVIRTGRPYWWIWIILIVPAIGVAAYLYLEVRPSLGKQWFHTLLWNLKTPRQRIGLLEEQLGESTTVRNRLALADELHAAGEYDRECDVLSEGLRGAFKDDATLLMRLSEAHLEANRVDQARDLLAKATPEKSPDSQLQYALLQARIASRSRQPEADGLFQQLVSRKRSEGPRYYYAEHLLNNGGRDQAVGILKDILHQYRRGTVVWRYQERKWYQAAKRLLRSRKAPSPAGRGSG